MNLYADASVLLRRLLGQEQGLDGWERWDAVYSSQLAGVEARRTLHRLRLTGMYTDNQVAEAETTFRMIEASLIRLPVSRVVLARAAGPMPTVVRTLDAIHLATALRIREREGELLFATHDRQQALAATALGFDCIGA